MTIVQPTASQTVFIEACDNAMIKVQHGVSPQQAIAEAIEEVAAKGVGIVLYGNKRTNIEVAIARAVRTGVNQANADIVLQRCAELGVSYVKVSEHLGARVTNKNDYTNHSWWQGKVYKIDWNKPQFAQYKHEAEGHTKEIADMIGELQHEYPDFVDTCGYGDVQGICGANCRHSFSAFYPNIQTAPEPWVDKKANEKRYKEEQKARALERQIRATKREIAAYDGSKLDNPEVVERLRNAHARLDKQVNNYYDYCRTHKINADGSRMIISKDNNSQIYAPRPMEAEQSNKGLDDTFRINKEEIYSDKYVEKIKSLGEDKITTKKILEEARKTLDHRNGTEFEDLTFINSVTHTTKSRRNYDNIRHCTPSKAMLNMLDNNPYTIIAIHNHPSNSMPSIDDIKVCEIRMYKYGLIVGHSGVIYKYSIVDSVNEPLYKMAFDILDNSGYNDVSVKRFFKEALEAGVKIEVIK